MSDLLEEGRHIIEQKDAQILALMKIAVAAKELRMIGREFDAAVRNNKIEKATWESIVEGQRQYDLAVDKYESTYGEIGGGG